MLRTDQYPDDGDSLEADDTGTNPTSTPPPSTPPSQWTPQDWMRYSLSRRTDATYPHVAEAVLPPWTKGTMHGQSNMPPISVQYSDPLSQTPDSDRGTAAYTADNHIIADPDVTSLRQVIPHELGHAFWAITSNGSDVLPDYVRQQWEHIHDGELKRHDPYRTIAKYSDNPSHSFADSYGDYVNQPEYMRIHRPALYNWFRAVVGQEYRPGSGLSRTSPSANIPLPSRPGSDE